MLSLRRLARMWRNLRRRKHVEGELSEELRSYVDLLVADHIAAGHDPREARRMALIEFGGMEQVKENVREVRMGHHLETLWQDTRYGIRMLARTPVFTVTAVVILALGIGGTSLLFSVVDRLLLHPFTYPQADRLVGVWESNPRNPRNEIAAANYLDWKNRNPAFEEIGALNFWSANLTGVDLPERLQGFQVSPSLFPLLGVQPEQGRYFLPEEDQPGKDAVVILSHGLWQRLFAGDPNAVGKTINLNSRTYTIVGVMPPDFQVHRTAELWSPLSLTPAIWANRQSHFLIAIARLRGGYTVKQAAAAMDTLAADLQQQYPQTNSNWGAAVVPLAEQAASNVRPAALLLLAATALVLLIACANVANLLLARGATRQREIAVRLALGSSRGRLVRQFLTESLLLAVLGGLAGLALALWGAGVLVSHLPEGVVFALPQVKEIHIDLRALGFTLLLSLGTGIVFGLAPALQSSGIDLNHAIKEGGRTASAGVRGRRIRGLLVIGEVALSAVLLICAGLLVRSVVRLLDVNPGFNAENVLTMRTTLPRAKYRDAAQVRGFYQEAIDRLSSLPGVRTVDAINHLPMGGSNESDGFNIEGEPPLPPSRRPEVASRIIGPAYFDVLGIPLIEGRAFTAADNESSPGAVIVSESLARRYFSGSDPLGKRIRTDPKSQWFSIVGIAADVRHWGLDREPEPTMYFHFRQEPDRSMVLVIRTAADAMGVLPAVRGEIVAMDKDQPVFEIQTLKNAAGESIALSRYTAVLLGAFAAVALALAAVGLYGIVSYSVAQRISELGIRIALGAQPRHVLQLVVRQGLTLALVGMALGLPAAMVASRLMAGLLFGISSLDLITFLSIPLLLLAVTLSACYVPARRAARIDPMVALRYE